MLEPMLRGFPSNSCLIPYLLLWLPFKVRTQLMSSIVQFSGNVKGPASVFKPLTNVTYEACPNCLAILILLVY